MIDIKDIRPIPKYIEKLIKIEDNNLQEKPNGNTRFYKYYTKFKNELCEAIVAVRNHYKKWYCKQVVVHAIHNEECFLRDIRQTMGYIKVGWFREGISKYMTWNDYDWGWNDDRYFNLTSAIAVNKDFILTLPEYKYSAIDLYKYHDVLNYIRLYEQYPQAELLVKCGLSKLATGKLILRQCAKDKRFCKWLYNNKDYITQNRYYVTSLVRAYKQNKTIKEVYEMDNFKLLFSREDNFKRIKKMLKPNETEKFLQYLTKQNTNGYSYTDYLNACEYLGLDMNEEKHRYPHDFKKWHDIRIDQYNTKKALEEEQARKELFERFSSVANKYVSLERLLIKDNYICLIAKSPQQLVYEGQELHHCVGRMNYDQKFAREETLIFFIRNRLYPNAPLVTLEYSLKTHKILQCYGYEDSKPTEDILQFVNKVWLPYANRKIRKIA